MLIVYLKRPEPIQVDINISQLEVVVSQHGATIYRHLQHQNVRPSASLVLEVKTRFTGETDSFDQCG